jgi:hypothetical protein
LEPHFATEELERMAATDDRDRKLGPLHARDSG